MNCEQAQNLFDSYLDGELTGSLLAEFGAHRLSCASCRRELALLEVAGHVISADAEVPSLPEDFTDRLLACATEEPRPWYRRRHWMVYVGPTFAAAACLALMFLPISNPPDEVNDGTVLVEPGVAGERDQVDSPEEVWAQIKAARAKDPTNPKLEQLDEIFQAWVEGTDDWPGLLEKHGLDTIKEMLTAFSIDPPMAPKASEPEPEVEGENDPAKDDL